MRWRGEGGGGERKRQTHGDDVGVAYDSIGQREGDDDLEFERGHVTVHGDFLQCVEEAEVAALGWRFGRCPDCAQEGWLVRRGMLCHGDGGGAAAYCARR